MNIILNFLPLFIVIYILILYFSVINHMIKNNSLNRNHKMYWLFIIIAFPILGSLFYFKKNNNKI